MANVQGKFYRGETQRRGVTPVSPPNAEDDPQDPLNPPGSGNTTTYKQLGDTTDKDFIGKNGYIPVVVGENALTLQPNIPNTGAAVFGGVVFNSTTTVDIGIVKGYIVDNETDPLVSSVQYIEYAGATGVTVTTLGSGTRSYGLLKSDGTIHFQNTFPTSEERKEMIYLFKVGHPAGLITVVANEPDFVLSPLQQFRDLFQAFNYVNEGVYPYPDAADLTFNTSAGIIVGNGINFVADTLNPNTLPVAATVPCTFVYRTQTGAGGTPTTLITPNSYDNAGTITTVGGGSNRSTLQYIHYSPNLGFVIQYGQTIYDSLVEAISAIGKETHVVYENLIRDALLIGVLALTRTTTDLTDTVDARFYRADIFGQLVGSAAGTSVTTLQRAYLNSLIPQIETVSGELVIKNGGALDTEVVFAIRDLLDVDNFTITGDGDVTANSFIKSGGTSAQYLKADGSVSGVSPYILDQVGAADGDALTWVAANSRYEPVAGGGGGITGSGTTNEIAYFTGSTAIASLPTATYPSLTELSYVKGVTSALQTQLNGKQATIAGTLTNGHVATIVAGVPTWTAPTAVSNWTVTGSGIYRNSQVSIGSTGLPPGNGTLKINSLGTGAGNAPLQIHSFADVLVASITKEGRFGSGNISPLYPFHSINSSTGSTFNMSLEQTNAAGTSGLRIVNSASKQAILQLTGPSYPSSLGNFFFIGLNSTGTDMVLAPNFNTTGSTTEKTIFRNGGFTAAFNVAYFDIDGLTFIDAKNIILGTTTGTKIGTATTQKLAFWNKTPIIQPTNAITASAFVANTSGIVDDTATYGGYTMGQIAAALINTGILA